jgi:hypothetical protein
MTSTIEIPKRKVTNPSRKPVCAVLMPDSDIDRFDISIPHFMFDGSIIIEQ